MIHRIDHLGIAVASLDEAIPVFEALTGGKCAGVEVVPEQKVRTAFFKVGEVSLELLEPLDDSSPVAVSIAKRGQGLHHLAFASDNAAEELERIGGTGARLIDKAPRTGAGGKLVGFVHPKSAEGVLVEICSDGGCGGERP